jgi:hypothetical protein
MAHRHARYGDCDVPGADRSGTIGHTACLLRRGRLCLHAYLVTRARSQQCCKRVTAVSHDCNVTTPSELQYQSGAGQTGDSRVHRVGVLSSGSATTASVEKGYTTHSSCNCRHQSVGNCHRQLRHFFSQRLELLRSGARPSGRAFYSAQLPADHLKCHVCDRNQVPEGQWHTALNRSRSAIEQAVEYNSLLTVRILGGLRKVAGWRGGRAVECTGLENRRRSDPIVSSNLTLSAKIKKALKPCVLGAATPPFECALA